MYEESRVKKISFNLMQLLKNTCQILCLCVCTLHLPHPLQFSFCGLYYNLSAPGLWSQRCFLYMKPLTRVIMLWRGNKCPTFPLHKVNDIFHLLLLIFVLQSQHTHTPPPTPPPFPPCFRKQQIFFIFFFFSSPLFVCQRVIKMCLLCLGGNTQAETSAAEPTTWGPLLHADELSMDTQPWELGGKHGGLRLPPLPSFSQTKWAVLIFTVTGTYRVY